MSTLRMHSTGAHGRRAMPQKRLPGVWGRHAQIAGGVLLLAAVGVVTATAISTSSGSTRSIPIPAGTRITGALDHSISTENGRVGQPVTLKTTEPINLESAALPPGIVLHGEVTHTKGGGRVAGAPELTIRFSRLDTGIRSYDIVADPFRLRGKNDAVESAAEVGGGALIGGIVGAVAGDAVKGAVIGGVLGTGVAVATKGNQIVLSAGQKLAVRLSEPVTVKYDAKAENK